MGESVENGSGDQHASLVRVKGMDGPARYRLRAAVTRIGRDASNDIVIQAPTVSARHCEIRREHNRYWIHDLNSTNGTFVNGNRVERAGLQSNSLIRFGTSGSEFCLELEKRAAELDQTLVLPSGQGQDRLDDGSQPRTSSSKPRITVEDEKLLSKAVNRAREAREMGLLDQTQAIMREMLDVSKRRSNRKWRWVTLVLLAALVAVAGFGYWRVQEIRAEKTGLDQRIEQIEKRLASGDLEDAEVDELMEHLEHYQRQAESLQANLLFQWGILGEEHLFIQREVRRLLRRFGAEAYSIPPEFVQQVSRFIERYQTRDRKHVERILHAGEKLQAMQKIFEEANLPGDLAYMAMVESAFLAGSRSREGAAGLWQFRAATARQYGLTVNSEVDERYDIEKSTRAASRYIRRLILEFGAGSSVMLALAAYNVGPTKVKRAVRRVEDPINERNFWYLYRTRALPTETRQYIPKIFAAILIGRNPERFGFSPAKP